MKPYRFLFLTGLFVVTVFVYQEVFASTVQISAVVPGCGDGIVEASEQCDGANLGGVSCQTLGFGAGALSCSSACTFTTSQCSIRAVDSNRGGGISSIDVPPTDVVPKTDFNNDGKVNLTDFSVVAYWYGRSLPPSFVDLNADGRVDLLDFSILAFYWTG